MSDGVHPCRLSIPMAYLSPKVIWRYIMVGFLSWSRTEDYRIPGHLSICGIVLHLVYEFAQSNRGMKLPCAAGAVDL